MSDAKTDHPGPGGESLRCFSPPTTMKTNKVTALARILLYYVLYSRALSVYRHLRARGIIGSSREVYGRINNAIIQLVLRLPSSQAKVEKELSSLRKDLAAKLAPPRPHLRRDLVLPALGLSSQELDDELAKLARLGGEESKAKGQDEEDWRSGRVSGAVYGLREVDEIIVKAYSQFAITNPLHPDVFPAVRKMEAEIVSMVLGLYNNPTGAGSTTSGGTESILVACKAYRDWGKATKGITQPEMIVPTTAHAAFWKASDYFGIKLHPIEVDPITRKVPLHLVKRAINSNTVLLVGSAPNFPDGTVDPIAELGALALRYKLGLHVDCCLGSFVIPFLEKAGFESPEFDFRVPGVTSISSDLHKYGFAPKGISTLMWKNAEWRAHQFYVLPGWKGGLYASPTLAGSRPGALIAGAWAVLMHHGEAGYIASTTRIMTTMCAIRDGILASPTLSQDLYILGDPKVSVVAFASKSKDVDILQVGDAMSKRGWHLNALEGPSALHMACTMLTDAEALLKDLEIVIAETKVKVKTEGEKDGTMVALYGLGQSSAGALLIPQVARAFLETLYLA